MEKNVHVQNECDGKSSRESGELLEWRTFMHTNVFMYNTVFFKRESELPFSPNFQMMFSILGFKGIYEDHTHEFK